MSLAIEELFHGFMSVHAIKVVFHDSVPASYYSMTIHSWSFFSRVNFECRLLFGVHSTPVLPQWHVKDPGPSAKSAGGRLHLNTHTPLTQRSRSGLTMPLSKHSVGTYPETSSQAARQGTLGHSSLSLLTHCGLILA